MNGERPIATVGYYMIHTEGIHFIRGLIFQVENSVWKDIIRNDERRERIMLLINEHGRGHQRLGIWCIHKMKWFKIASNGRIYMY